MTGIESRTGLLDAGVTAAQIDAAIRGGRLLTPYRGIYAPGPELPGTDRCRAALMTQPPGSVLSHRSAAVLHRLPWIPEEWSAADQVVDMTVPVTDGRRERAGLRIRRSTVPDETTLRADGLPLTSVARTLIDLIRERDVGRLLGLQLLDGAVRFDHCSVDKLRDQVAAATGSRRIAIARALIGLVREGVDSPQETRLRLTLIDGGVRPERIDVNLEIRDTDGLLLARGDLGSRRSLLWWEYDGFAVHTEKPAFGADRAGDRWLEGRGWSVMRFSAVDFEHPARIVADWQRAIRQAPRRIAAMASSRSPEVAAARQLLGLDRPPT